MGSNEADAYNLFISNVGWCYFYTKMFNKCQLVYVYSDKCQGIQTLADFTTLFINDKRICDLTQEVNLSLPSIAVTQMDPSLKQ